MTNAHRTAIPTLALVLAGCSAAIHAPSAAVQSTQSGSPQVQSTTATVNAADVAFLQGMIHHHAQAVLMAGWAPSHGASPAVAEVCRRIVVSQRDEIALMSNWLRDHHQAVPVVDPEHDVMHMPGMLNAAQLDTLDAARGPAFDRDFLTFMIMHHEGALSMVQTLFDTDGAGQNDDIFALATNINADQTAEIDRMSRMLSAMKAE